MNWFTRACEDNVYYYWVNNVSDYTSWPAWVYVRWQAEKYADKDGNLSLGGHQGPEKFK